MTTVRSTYPLTFKALGDGTNGEFEAAFAVFGTVDLVGDRLMPGSLDKSIADWKAGVDPLPVIWTHDWADPFAHIGEMDPKTLRIEDNKLVGKGTLDMANPLAAQVYSLMKRRTVKEFSFTSLVTDERPGKDGANEIWEAQLVEMGPTLKGMNPDTELLKVKAQLLDAVNGDADHARMTQKAGRVLSAANETKLRDALTAITEVLAQLGEAADKAVAPPTPDVHVDATRKAQEPPTGATAEDEFDEDEFLRLEVAIEAAAL